MRWTLRTTVAVWLVGVAAAVAACPDGECGSDSDCNGDDLCVDGDCVECGSDSDCDGGEICDDGDCERVELGEGEGEEGEGEEGEGEEGEGEEGEGEEGEGEEGEGEEGEGEGEQQPCIDDTQCTDSISTFCTDDGFCDVPTCQNGGSTCEPGQTCAANATCVVGSGIACDNDGDCPSDEFCRASLLGDSVCVDGCRNNASCAPNQACNGLHECAAASSVNDFGETCATDADCEAGLICGSFTGTCTELCAAPDATACAVEGCCEVSGAACCSDPFGFGVGFCSSSGC